MGAVYEGRQKSLDCVVAIKIFPSEVAPLAHYDTLDGVARDQVGQLRQIEGATLIHPRATRKSDAHRSPVGFSSMRTTN